MTSIFKFTVVTFLILFSFALGFTHLFGPYSDLRECDDQVDDDHCGNAHMFKRWPSFMILLSRQLDIAKYRSVEVSDDIWQRFLKQLLYERIWDIVITSEIVLWDKSIFLFNHF